jgi:hypothetical protein
LWKKAAHHEPPLTFSLRSPRKIPNESRGYRAANNKSARCAAKTEFQKEKPTKNEAKAVIPSTKRQSDYQGYRTGTPERPIIISSLPILVGAVLIAAAILLSTVLNTLGTRYFGFEGPTEESAWLIDRLTGHVYRCEAPSRGRATCDADIATGSIATKPKP